MPILLILLTALTLCQPTNWTPFFRDPNPVNRATLASALYYRGSIDITPEVNRLPQQDVIEIGGHVFGSKAPGSSLWLLIFAPFVDALVPGSLTPMQLVVFGRFIALTLPWLLFCWWFARRLTLISGAVTAWGLILLMNFGSNAGAYATTYYGHALTAICLGVSLMLARERGDTAKAALAGLLAGCAVLIETNVLPLALGNLLICVLSGDRGGRLQRAAAFAAGMVPGCAILAFYNTITSGYPWVSIFKFDPIHKEFATAGRPEGLYGFWLPSAESMFGVWLSPKRGWIYQAPWVLPVVGYGAARAFGWLRSLKKFGGDGDLNPDTNTDAAAGVSGLMVLLFTFLMSAYSIWDGGNSLGVRFLVPLIPYAIYLAAEALAKRWIRHEIFWGLAAVAVAIHGVSFLFFPYNPSDVSIWCNFPLSFAVDLLRHDYRIPLWWDMIDSRGCWQLIPFMAPMIAAWLAWAVWALGAVGSAPPARVRTPLRQWGIGLVVASAAVVSVFLSNDPTVRADDGYAERRPLMRPEDGTYRENFKTFLWSKEDPDFANPQFKKKQIPLSLKKSNI